MFPVQSNTIIIFLSIQQQRLFWLYANVRQITNLPMFIQTISEEWFPYNCSMLFLALNMFTRQLSDVSVRHSGEDMTCETDLQSKILKNLTYNCKNFRAIRQDFPCSKVRVPLQMLSASFRVCK